MQYGAKNDLSVIRSGMLKRLLNLLVYTQRMFSLEHSAGMARSQRWSLELVGGLGGGRGWQGGTAAGLGGRGVYASSVGSLSPFNRAHHKNAHSLALKPGNFGFESLWTRVFS